jgi:predicted enzyme related to lactoylglutathione lyase
MEEARMSGRFTWNELMTNDIARTKAFYGQTLGWTFDPFPMPDGEYWIAKAPDGTPAAGIMPMDPQDTESQPGWLAYVQVDDLDRAVMAVTSAGGQILQPAMDIPNVGRIAVIEDPAGAVIGLMKPAGTPQS